MSAELVYVKLSLKEASVIKKLRGIDFGDVYVYKSKGIIQRVKIIKSEIPNDKEGLELIKEQIPKNNNY